MLIGAGRTVSFAMTAWRRRGPETVSTHKSVLRVRWLVPYTREPHGTGIMSELVANAM